MKNNNKKSNGKMVKVLIVVGIVLILLFVVSQRTKEPPAEAPKEMVRMDEPDKDEAEAPKEEEPSTESTSTEASEEDTEVSTETATESISEASSEAATEDVSEVSTETASESEESEEGANADGVTPEFKKTMDDYEAFFDEYVEFTKHMDSNNSPGAALDYIQMLDKYNKSMKELDEIKEKDMTKADYAYYLDTMNRINKKLLDVS